MLSVCIVTRALGELCPPAAVSWVTRRCSIELYSCLSFLPYRTILQWCVLNALRHMCLLCVGGGIVLKPSLPGIHIPALLNIICQRHLHLHLIYGLIVVKDEMVFLNFVSIGSLFTVQPVSRRSQTKLIKSVQSAQCIPALCRFLSDGNRRHMYESIEEKMYARSSHQFTR